MSWAVVESHDSIHVIPIDDKSDHDATADCHCSPRYDDGVYIHPSFDGREVLEMMCPDGQC